MSKYSLKTHQDRSRAAINLIKVNKARANALISIAADGYDPVHMVSVGEFHPIHLTYMDPSEKDSSTYVTNPPKKVPGARQPTHCAVFTQASCSQRSARRPSTVTDKLLEELELDNVISDDSKNILCAYIFRNIIGREFIFSGPFGKNRGRSGCLQYYCDHYCRQVFTIWAGVKFSGHRIAQLSVLCLCLLIQSREEAYIQTRFSGLGLSCCVELLS